MGTDDGRRGSLTGTDGAGKAGGGRRKSSGTLNLNFTALAKEKIVPIDEDRDAEGKKEEASHGRSLEKSSGGAPGGLG